MVTYMFRAWFIWAQNFYIFMFYEKFKQDQTEVQMQTTL